jgi:hypothetical protein
MARERQGLIRPEDLYRWPDEIQQRLGLGRSVYDLVRVGGLRVFSFARRRYVRGHEVISALESLAEDSSDDDAGLALRTVDQSEAYQVDPAPQASRQRQADASAAAAPVVAPQAGTQS